MAKATATRDQLATTDNAKSGPLTDKRIAAFIAEKKDYWRADKMGGRGAGSLVLRVMPSGESGAGAT